MKADNALPRIKYVLFVLTSIQLFFALATVPSNGLTTSTYFKLPFSILDFSFSTQSITALYVTFWVCSAFVLISIIDAAVVAVIFTKEDNTVLVCSCSKV